MPGNAIFMSIRPQYANKIFDGIKTVELRRVRPKYIARKALIFSGRFLPVILTR